MLTGINPKLSMLNKRLTRGFYINQSGLEQVCTVDYDGYLMMKLSGLRIIKTSLW